MRSHIRQDCIEQLNLVDAIEMHSQTEAFAFDVQSQIAKFILSQSNHKAFEEYMGLIN